MAKEKLERPLNIQIFLKGEKIFEKIFEEYPVILGRSSKCDIPLTKADFLSRQHCSITVENTKVLVVDLESSNGIYLGKEKIKFAEIKDKLNVMVGELEMRFEFQIPHSLPNHQLDTLVLKETEKTKTKTATSSSSLLETPEKKKETIKKVLAEECPVVKESEKRVLPTKPKIPLALDAEIQTHKTEKKEKTVKKTKAKKSSSLVRPHVQASQLRPQLRVLESSVTWKDQLYDVVQYRPGQAVILGSIDEADLHVPIIKKQTMLAKYDGMNTRVFIPQNVRFELCNETRKIDFEEAIQSPLVTKRANYYELKMNTNEVVTLHYTDDVAVHLRYIPAPRQLSREQGLLADKELKSKTFIAGTVHFLLFLALLLTEPKSKGPHLKNVPDRYARLLIKKPEPFKKPEPPKPPPEKKVAEKKPEPPKPHENTRKIVKVQPKIHKIIKLQKSKLLAKVNKWPVEVSRPMKPVVKPTVSNIQSVGALAALNAFSSKAPSNVPVAININKNAGGQSALNTGGVIGALKTASGKLAAGGFASVKTKGLGYGTGTGYGVQGIQGTAGGRSVAGVVVGMPALVHFTKQEGLTRDQVMSVVRQHIAEIQQCYERSLIDNPKLAGRVEYEWEISARGNVQYAKVKKSDISNGDNLNNCVVGVFKNMRFPIAKNGQTTVPNIGFPFGRL